MGSRPASRATSRTPSSRLIPGLEHAEIMRYGYAVEYDLRPAHPAGPRDPGNQGRPRAVPSRPDQRHHRIRGGRRPGPASPGSTPPSLAKGEQPPFIVDRSRGYIGVLIDDLVTREAWTNPIGCSPAGPSTASSSASDNADLRLTPNKAATVGLVDDARWNSIRVPSRADRAVSGPLLEVESGAGGDTLEQVLRRPSTTWDEILVALHPAVDRRFPTTSRPSSRSRSRPSTAVTSHRQADQVERFRRLEDKPLPEWTSTTARDRPAPGRGPREVRPGPPPLARPGRADQRDQPGRCRQPIGPPQTAVVVILLSRIRTRSESCGFFSPVGAEKRIRWRTCDICDRPKGWHHVYHQRLTTPE